MTSLKVKLFTALESLLRVPPLIIVDEIFRSNFGIGAGNKLYLQQPVGILTPFQKSIERIHQNYARERAKEMEIELAKAQDTSSEYLNETVLSNASLGIGTEPAGTPPTTNTTVGEVLSDFFDAFRVWDTLFDGLVHAINSTLHNGFSGSSHTPAAPSTSTIVPGEEVAAAAAGVTSATPTPSPQEPHYEFSTAQAAADLMKLAEIIMCIVLFIAAVITFMLATENLIKLYSYLVSFFALYLSFIFAPFPTAFALASIPALLYNITCRSALAAVYYASRSWPGGGAGDGASGFNLTGAPNNNVPGRVRADAGGGRGSSGRVAVEPNNTQHCHAPTLSNATEFLLLSMFFVPGAVTIHPVAYVIILVCLHHPLVRCIPEIIAFLNASWTETKRVQNEYGLSHLIQVESGRLRVNTVFRLFWVTRAAYDAISKCCDEPFNSLIRYVMTHGTETFTGVVGLTVTVSAICHQIGEFLLFLLYNGANTEADVNRFGSISTVLFFILSLQTGLTSLDPEKRLDRLAKNIVLLGTALFHALHQMISPVLTAFRAFQTLQIRAAALSCISFVVSGCLTFYLLRYATVSTWSLAVLALAIEFKIKIFISLLISFVVYLSQLVQYPEPLERMLGAVRRTMPTFFVRFFDHLHDEMSHEDVVFYLRSFANVGEFLTGIFLFANAIWIFFFESASAIRAIGMSVHAYFNIWCEAQKGWRIYCLRKTASQKIMSLADATEEQLRSRQDDVCAVCYEEMESAKVTLCNHLFHAVCLRKWLYVQNTCPLCHEVLYREDALAPGNEVVAQPALPPARLQAPVQVHQPSANAPVPPPQQVRQTDSRTTTSGTTASSASTRNYAAAARRGSRQATYERGDVSSDDNDTETDQPSTSRERVRSHRSNPGGAARLEPVRYSVYSSSGSGDSSSSGGSSSGEGNGARSRFFGRRSSDSENGNYSEYTVDDGSERDFDLSSSDEDEPREGGGDGDRRRRHQAPAIGVPLLL